MSRKLETFLERIEVRHSLYGSKYARFLRLLEDLKLIPEGEEPVFNTRCGHEVELIEPTPENLALTVKYTGVKIRTKAPGTKWKELNLVENRIKASSMQYETGAGDHGGWQIRLTEDVVGADSIDLVFSEKNDWFLYVRVNRG